MYVEAVSPHFSFTPGTYIFDQGDPSNDTHPIRFSTIPNGTWTHDDAEYTATVSNNGIAAGVAGSETTLVVTESTPLPMYYYCAAHPNMGDNVS